MQVPSSGSTGQMVGVFEAYDLRAELREMREGRPLLGRWARMNGSGFVPGSYDNNRVWRAGPGAAQGLVERLSRTADFPGKAKIEVLATKAARQAELAYNPVHASDKAGVRWSAPSGDVGHKWAPDIHTGAAEWQRETTAARVDAWNGYCKTLDELDPALRAATRDGVHYARAVGVGALLGVAAVTGYVMHKV